MASNNTTNNGTEDTPNNAVGRGSTLNSILNNIIRNVENNAANSSPNNPSSSTNGSTNSPRSNAVPNVAHRGTNTVAINTNFDHEFDLADMPIVLQAWEARHTQNGFDPVPVLKRLAEIFEKEFDIYMRKDPDPFDERHPYRTDPTCQFGVLLKQLFRKESFMNKLLNDYLRDNYFTRQNVQKSSLEVNIFACRLILVIMPGMETSAVFQIELDHLINRLYSWAEDSIEPLQSYATGLLGSAMEVQEIVMAYREQNIRLVPKLIRRLHMLQAFYKPSLDFESQGSQNVAENSSTMDAEVASNIVSNIPSWMVESAPQSPQRIEENQNQPTSNVILENLASNSNLSLLLENSRDAQTSGANARKLYIPIYPPTSETSQMLIMRYLTAMGEYQDLLGLVFENNALPLINGFITNLDPRDTRLAFEALKYLASLLVHKKFALRFIDCGGLELLLKIPRSSLASTGVAICLYYLAYAEDAMERICTMPRELIENLVSYALWLLVRSYDSGKCHATMFFGLSFQFKVILDEFDYQDGLRKLYNVTAILKILNPSVEDDAESNEDIECASRQLVRHVCVALKRYMESHLFYKYNDFMRLQGPTVNNFSKNITKATKANLEQINEQVRTLQEHISVRTFWKPVDNLLGLGGVKLLLKIIALSYDWTNTGKAETMRSALDVLSICCVVPQIYAALCDRIEMTDLSINSGMSAILGCAAGEYADAEVQKSALAVICNCVCSPLMKKDPLNAIKSLKEPCTTKAWNAARRRQNAKYVEDLVEKVWESVCGNSGIIVLLLLVQVKAPITDADCIRGMACRALAGLARSERVRQIIGKLPLFANGQIQTLMRDPILQEKRTEHVIFQKYALELLERVSGKTKPFKHQLDPSLSNIHKANIIAQTKIQYNEQQLLQLIHEHLESKGLNMAAQALQKEAGLPTQTTSLKCFHQSPFDYKMMQSSSLGRTRLRNRMHDVQMAINNCTNEQFNEEPHSSNSAVVTPIKLVRKMEKVCTSGGQSAGGSSSASSQRSLQKQITSNYFDDSMQDNDTLYKNNNITLSTIVTEYLTNQHALCKNPMATCPPFDLFTPHKCPDPKPNRVLGNAQNITARLFKAQAGFRTESFDRRYVHSNIAPWNTIRSSDYGETQYTCCTFLPHSCYVMCGTQQGDVKAFNTNDCSEIFSFDCCNDCIDVIQTNRSGNLILLSCSWRQQVSMLWSLTANNELIHRYDFEQDSYCEFSNLAQDKLLGTMNEFAHLYDIPTGQKISTFKANLTNQYSKNRATFYPTDELILSDGVLWDVRTHKEIHKFDKLNQTLSGVFHPNGIELISNTEIWDMRTFHLLQTVPVLNQSFIKFSAQKVLYGYSYEIDIRNEFEENTNYDTSFKVLDGCDYTSISTIDVKRCIQDLAVHANGCTIATAEHHTGYDSKQETYIKLYSVGMKKNEQDDEEEEEERESDEDASESDNSGGPIELRPDGIFFGRRTRRRNQRGRNFRNDAPNNDNDEDEDNDEGIDGWEDMETGSEDSDDDEGNQYIELQVQDENENAVADSDEDDDNGEADEGAASDANMDNSDNDSSSENEFQQSRFRLA